ncbi:LPXTG cell wall anchor domain-containing protein [Anaerotruncus rubiinfantis]|uniref:LPXTG cell wall anchor domain-containing protein n=1 Tax=Anaerotruncus rubiinfantis TaxID=1720200 RepID=UPI00189A2B44|nr:LPXTG cell wall anchor domain-containing protein [Anaerotruncus rubiinfantis]
MQLFFKRFAALLLAVATFVLVSVPSFALLPETGDGSGSTMVLIGGLLILAVVLMIVYVILSKKRGR